MAVVANLEDDADPRFDELLALVDHVVVSEEFARKITGADSPRAALDRLDRLSRLLDIAFAVPGTNIRFGVEVTKAEFDEDDEHIDELPDLLERGLIIEERIALEAEYNGKKFFALNDVVVRKGGISRIVPFALCLNDEQAAHVPADGMLIATPTGSTAYFLSAGGSIISPQVDAFGVVPLLPHTLFSRPIIVPANSHIVIGCDSELAHANLECDGEVVSDVDPGSSVVIGRYPRTVRFARISRLRFFERLEQKLQWGVSIKGRQDRQ